MAEAMLPELVIDVSGILDVETMHEYLYKTLNFMPGYGFSFDALWDCITDDQLSKMPQHLIVEGLADFERRLPDAHKKLVACFLDYEREMKSRVVTLRSSSPSGGGLKIDDV